MIGLIFIVLGLCGLMYLIAWSIMKGAERQIDYHNEMKKRWEK